MARIKTIVASGVALSLILAGCQSDGSAAATDHALMCGKCETVWIPEVTSQGTKVTLLTSAAKMTCPTCDAMARSHLTGDGTVQLHDCPDCKVAPKPISSGPENPTHPKGAH